MQLCDASGRMIIEGVRMAPKYTYIDENKQESLLVLFEVYIYV